MNAQQAVAVDRTDMTIEPAAPSTALTPMQMAYQLAARGTDVATIKEMLAIGREMEADQARRAFDAALSAAKAEIPPIIKNREVDFTSTKGRTHYRHEDLGEIARTVDPILARHGLSYRFRTEQENGAVKVTCIVAHRDGHAEENALSGARDETGNKNSIQQVGSTITYLQRYTLKAALGLAATDDDDGASAVPPAGTINAKQMDDLRDLIERSGTDIEKFCATYQIEALPDFPAKGLEAAKNLLLMKIVRQKDAEK